jgi:hypothetical protein
LLDRLPKNNAGKKQIDNDKIKTTQSKGIIVNEENKDNLKSPYIFLFVIYQQNICNDNSIAWSGVKQFFSVPLGAKKKNTK